MAEKAVSGKIFRKRKKRAETLLTNHKIWCNILQCIIMDRYAVLFVERIISHLLRIIKHYLEFLT